MRSFVAIDIAVLMVFIYIPVLPHFAAGNIHSLAQVEELGYFGYNGVVLGRNLAEVHVLVLRAVQCIWQVFLLITIERLAVAAFSTR
jgi:phosphoribosylformimino-5-aminoimidazole carboxamide ribonucleotide (ProFAR) isomerase